MKWLALLTCGPGGNGFDCGKCKILAWTSRLTWLKLDTGNGLEK